METTLEKLVAISESFLQMGSDDIDYQDITDSFKDISGARFVAFNVYNESGLSYTTMATSGMSRHMQKIVSLLGFDIVGTSWDHDPVRAEKINDQVVTCFEKLSDLSGDVIPAMVINRLQQLFSLKEVYLIKIMKEKLLLGDFTFIMHQGASFTDSKAAEIFTRQLGLLLLHRRLEKKLKEQTEKANLANRAKSEFLANMSHEIRTPMNAILGFSEALYQRETQPDKKKMIESVLSGGKLLLSLLNDILDLSKIEAGKLELYITPVNPTTLLTETRMLFSEKAKKKGLGFQFTIHDEMPSQLFVDETRVKQIIFNLVSNAIKFTHQGHVRLVASFDRDASDWGTLHIRVEDTGIGISKELADHIFEDFNQLDPEITRKYEGTGLGLSICRRLVEKMQGEIALESTPKKGSVFFVTLPGIQYSDGSNTEDLTESSPLDNIVFEKNLVMVVDDNGSDIEMVESLLISLGLQSMHALSGREALQQLATRKPVLILLDTRMPVMNGYELLQTIKDDDTTKHIPVVSYSITVPQYASNPLSRLFIGHIQKPVRRQALIQELLRHLPYSEGIPQKKHDNFPYKLPKPLPPAATETLPLVLEGLNNTFWPQWKKIKDHLVIFKIEDFARKLHTFAAIHGFEYLQNYAQKLLREANSFDIEAMKETLERFPYICDEIKSVR